MSRTVSARGSVADVPKTDPITERYRADLGARIKLLRQACRLDQPQLAARLGVSKTTLSNWEMGYSEPVASQLAGLLEVADKAGTAVTAGWLLGMEEIQFGAVGAGPPEKKSNRGDKKS